MDLKWAQPTPDYSNFCFWMCGLGVIFRCLIIKKTIVARKIDLSCSGLKWCQDSQLSAYYDATFLSRSEACSSGGTERSSKHFWKIPWSEPSVFPFSKKWLLRFIARLLRTPLGATGWKKYPREEKPFTSYLQLKHIIRSSAQSLLFWEDDKNRLPTQSSH